MASNSFGKVFRFTSYGESHGPCVGVVIDGVPAGLRLDLEMIQAELDRRAPGQSPLTSPRQEKDRLQLLSGLFDGQTTGAPLCMQIANSDADSSKYAAIKDLLRPGHANYTYLSKYGIFDWRGGGRASARETAARVMAGAVAKQLLKPLNLCFTTDIDDRLAKEAEILTCKQEGDSIGASITCEVTCVPAGLGDPIYDKVEARLAYAMLSIPACCGFEMGAGFSACSRRGSEHNDAMIQDDFGPRFLSNHSGGTQGGLTTGQTLRFRVAFKPTSSITKAQSSLSIAGEPASFVLPAGSRHDPCVAVRAVCVVEAMTACVLADLWLSTHTARADQLGFPALQSAQGLVHLAPSQ